MKKVMSFLLSTLILISLLGCTNGNDEIYTITLELDGGTGDSSIVEESGTVITEPTPTKEGYTFTGWYFDTEYTTGYVFGTMPSGDITLYAQWVINTYTLTLELDGGTGDSSIVQEFGTAITNSPPTKEGFIFGGWYTTIEYTTEYVIDTMPSEDMTLYAKWNSNDFAITVSASIEGVTPTLVEGEIVNYNKTYTITTLEVDDYSFEYWRILDTTDIISFDLSFEYTPSSDIVLEAVYKENVASGEPTLFYETGFEDAAKAAYAEELVTLSNQSWNLADALIGSLATDLSVSGNSVRIRDGYIETKFVVEELAQVIFHAGTYALCRTG